MNIMLRTQRGFWKLFTFIPLTLAIVDVRHLSELHAWSLVHIPIRPYSAYDMTEVHSPKFLLQQVPLINNGSLIFIDMPCVGGRI